jgi:hypothetical protein
MNVYSPPNTRNQRRMALQNLLQHLARVPFRLKLLAIEIILCCASAVGLLPHELNSLKSEAGDTVASLSEKRARQGRINRAYTMACPTQPKGREHSCGYVGRGRDAIC